MSWTGSVTIIHNAVTAKLVDPEQEAKMWFSDVLSYEVQGHEHMGGSKSWNGRSSFFKSSDATFPAGFVRMIERRLRRRGCNVIVHSKPSPEPLGDLKPVVDDFGFDPRYSYQLDIMDRLVELKGMIAQAATGAGKSRCFKLCAERIGRPTIFVTTRKSLMWQMADNYAQTIGKPFGILGDGKWKPCPTGVNFAIIDTLASRLESKSAAQLYARSKEKALSDREAAIQAMLKKANLPVDLSIWKSPPEAVKAKVQYLRTKATEKLPIDFDALKAAAQKKALRQEKRRAETLEFLSKIEFVTLEEAHEVSSNSYYAVMNALKNAHYRLALTATPFMKEDEEANMKLMATTGAIGIKVTEKQLIDLGILAKPYFVYEKLKQPKGLYRSTKWHRAQSIGISENVERNALIEKHCLNAKDYGLPAMVLVTLTKHGKALQKQLSERGMRVKFISGESNQATRQDALDQLGNGQLDVLIGSTILDVGVDVPSVGVVILAGGGKAEVSLRQRIGRGLRAKKSGPNVAFVVDFQDTHNTILMRHYLKRRKVVEDIPGFGENIVDRFDFEAVGLTKKAAA